MSDYVFDLGEANQLLSLLEGVASTAGDPLALSFALLEVGTPPPVSEDLWDELQIFSGYELEEDDERPGVVEFRGRGFDLMGLGLRPLEEAGEQSHLLWRHLYSQTSTPLLRAQLADVLLTARLESGPKHAQDTIDVYLEVAETNSVDWLHRTLATLRANQIARSRGATATERTVRSKMLELARRSLDELRPAGIVLRLLNALSVAPRGDPNPAERMSTLEALSRAESVFADPHAADTIAEARRRLAADDSERAAATKTQVDSYMAAALAADSGLLRMHWAEKAAAIADVHGLRASHDEAIRFMQAIPEESMGWQVIESSIHLPRNALRQHLRRYRAVTDWRRAIQIFLASDSPTGSHEENIKANAEMSRGRFIALLSRTTHGPHGMPVRSGGDFIDEELRRLETFALQGKGILLTLELDEIKRRFGAVPSADLAPLLVELGGADENYAFAVADAMNLYWADDPSSAARLTIPLIESGMRRLLLLLDEPVYRIERGNSPGRFPAMDFYVDRLEERGLDIDWVRALRATLLGGGLNLRNFFAHGFQLAFTKEQAALLLRIAGMFAAMPVGTDDSLERPLQAVRRRLRRRIGWIYS